MLVVISFVVATILGISFYSWLMIYVKFKIGLKGIPGPTPVPLLGNALEMGLTTTDIVKFFDEITAKFGGISMVFLGHKPVLLLTDLEAIEFFLSSSTTIQKNFFYDFISNWLGRGLLTNWGDDWRRKRKFINPCFRVQILDNYLDNFEKISRKLIRKLTEKEIGKSRTEISEYMSLYSLDIICETTMGTSLNSLDNNNLEYVKAVKDVCRIIMERGFNPVQQVDLLYKYTKNYRDEMAALKVLHDYAMTVIRRRRKELEGQNLDGLVDEATGTKRKVSLLDLLLLGKCEGRSLSDEEVREEVDTFMFAGHDTVATAIGFALFNIAKHEHVQRKLFEEQQAVMGDKHRAPTTHDMNEMRYLEMTIKESLRVLPSVPYVGRYLDQDVKYKDMVIPKGVHLAILNMNVHKNPENFANPELFDPERFAPDRKHKSFSYLPFSSGPRNCIGQKFALMELKYTLSMLLRNFRVLSVGHELILSAETVLNSKNGVYIKLEPREWSADDPDNIIYSRRRKLDTQALSI